MEITQNSKLKTIKKIKEFQEFQEFLFPAPSMIGKILGQVKFKSLGTTKNIESVLDTLCYMRELINDNKKIFYQIYDKSEVIKDESLKEEVIFHFPVEKKAKLAIVCAGGGYAMVSSILEGFPIAKRLNELGYHAFVVNYRVGKNALAPNPQEDLANAVRFIMENADKLNVDTKDYAVIGFSAGGHLVASFGTNSLGYSHYNLEKPGALFLAYPVISMMDEVHAGSRRFLLGKENINNKELLEKYSIEMQITKEYPPTYVWQCNRDNTVPISNSQKLVESLKKNQILYQYNTYDSDAHGWGLGAGTLAEGWLDEAVLFWEQEYANGING